MHTRRNFPNSVKREAFARSNGICECYRVWQLPTYKTGCGQKLTGGNTFYEHITPDKLDGLNDLDNAAVLVKTCWKLKTSGYDRPKVDKWRRQQDRARGIRPRRSRCIPSWSPPMRDIAKLTGAATRSDDDGDIRLHVPMGATMSSAWENRPGKLWSLRDMLEYYVLYFFLLGRNLSSSQALFRFGQRLAELKPETENPWDKLVGTGVTDNIEGVLRVATHLGLTSVADQLRRINRDASNLNANPASLAREIDDLLKRLEDEFQRRKFLYVPDDLVQYYEGAHEIFGAAVAKKFPKAMEDFKEAGKCLAVGQGTACVFHLMRAVEFVVRRLAKRKPFKMNVHEKTTWVVLTNNMGQKIKAWPEQTDAQKKKKEDWDSARAWLHKIGIRVRNPTMHPANSYTHREALDIFDAVRMFMVEIAKL